jgi:hypothetical protein
VITRLAATGYDVHELMPRLREEDRAEVLALGFTPVDGLLQSIVGAQEAWTYRADRQIICMAGITPLSLIGRVGVPWLLGSELVLQHRRTFMMETRRMVAHWLTLFDVLRNVVDVRYEAAIRWLRWLHFKIGEPFPLGNGTFRVACKEVA